LSQIRHDLRHRTDWDAILENPAEMICAVAAGTDFPVKMTSGDELIDRVLNAILCRTAFRRKASHARPCVSLSFVKEAGESIGESKCKIGQLRISMNLVKP
jgi:hypothetical protein